MGNGRHLVERSKAAGPCARRLDGAVNLTTYRMPGLSSLRVEFFRLNDEANVKKLIKHLLFGTGDFVLRANDCIYSPKYKIHSFSRSCVLELFGWINDQEI